MALITGAASGIGRATAHTFVAEGCTRLILSDINAVGLQTVSDELKNLDSTVQTCLVKCDISSENEVQHMVDEGVKAFGAVHYAVNNAGITSNPRVRTHQLETSSWDAVQQVNLRGVWLCERAELRQMMKQEAILQPRCGQNAFVFLVEYELTFVISRTGAPLQRGSIVNVSSLFGIISHPTVGAVCPVTNWLWSLFRLTTFVVFSDQSRRLRDDTY